MPRPKRIAAAETIAPAEAHATPPAADAPGEQPPNPLESPAAQKSGVFAVYSDQRNGIRIEKELARQPGQTRPRILIRFADDKRPSDPEKQRLKEEGFRFDFAVMAWAKPYSAESQYLAKQVVTDILKERGASSGLYL
jgi:hypothetical protein